MWSLPLPAHKDHHHVMVPETGQHARVHVLNCFGLNLGTLGPKYITIWVMELRPRAKLALRSSDYKPAADADVKV